MAVLGMQTGLSRKNILSLVSERLRLLGHVSAGAARTSERVQVPV